MGWKRDAKLVRCLFPTGFECENHSLVISGPEAIDVIIFHVDCTIFPSLKLLRY